MNIKLNLKLKVLGYLLNNGTYGVCFNDSTKIFCSLKNKSVIIN